MIDNSLTNEQMKTDEIFESFLVCLKLWVVGWVGLGSGWAKLNVLQKRWQFVVRCLHVCMVVARSSTITANWRIWAEVFQILAECFFVNLGVVFKFEDEILILYNGQK